MRIIPFFIAIVTAFATGGMVLTDPDKYQEHLNKGPRFSFWPVSRRGVILQGWVLIIMGIIGLLLLPTLLAME